METAKSNTAKKPENGKNETKPATNPATPENNQQKKADPVADARKALDDKIEKIQRFSGMQTRLATLRATLLKLQDFKYTSTRNNDILTLKDGAEYSNEFKTSSVRYVEKVRDFIISELKKDIEATEVEIQAATL